MAKSQFEYVREYEVHDEMLRSCWLVVRLDGRAFTKFTSAHGFTKPNDRRGLRLMNHCAATVMREFPHDVCLAYGQSDEYSFVLRRASNLYSRRASKLCSTMASLFTSAFVFAWRDFFGEDGVVLQRPPVFDGRVVPYPTDQTLRDYLSWRQADCHVNNLYNTCFWALVQQGGLSVRDAEARLNGTVSAEKHELLFSEFGINYNNEPPMFRKGTVLVRGVHAVTVVREDARTGEVHEVTRNKPCVEALHVDLIGDGFWKERPEILTPMSKTQLWKLQKARMGKGKGGKGGKGKKGDEAADEADEASEASAAAAPSGS